ncbi:MAG: heparan-alpha-glucosaminide N-acetyltransferase domain-containing protein [bacterium]
MAKTNRAQFIDMLKGWALLVMIEVHVFNSFLNPEIKSQSWFSIINFINGLVAPAFTFTSGMVFILSFQKGLDELRKFGTKFWKRLGRLTLIFIAGYSIHITHLSLRKISNPEYPYMLQEFYRVDILQCIAVGLILLMFIRMLIKSDNIFFATILLLDVLLIVLGPLAWKTDFTNYMPLALANYFNPMYGSLFPLFPWIAFIFTGALFGKLYIEFKNRNEEKRFAMYLAIGGAVCFVISFILLGYIFPDSIKILKPNFVFFIERVCALLALLGIFWFYINRYENYNSFILDVSRESLQVYWLHLMLLHGRFFNGKNIIDVLGNQNNILTCLGITVFLAVLMIFIAKGWGWLKAKYPVIISRFVLVTVSVCLLIFFIF